MKKIFFFLIALASFITSCKKGSPITDPLPPASKGTPMPKGNPIGDAVTKTIGPFGGTISSIDNNIIVTVPAGAVSANTEFSIQPITNTAPNGIGISYLLLPEGKHFDKPVSIQLKYTDYDIDGSSPEVLYLAYQDSIGIWHSKDDTKVDSVAKTLSVASDHFSRWAGFADIFLLVDKPSIDLKESSHLQVRRIALSKALQPVDGEKILDTTYPSQIRVDSWSVFGGGTINGSLTGTGTYTADASPPSPNPVTVTAFVADISDLNHIHQTSLKRKIYVHNTFLEIVMDGETNIYPGDTLTVVNNTNPGYMSFTGHNSKGNGAVFVLTGTGAGSYQWGNDNNKAGADIQIKIGGVSLSDLYVTCNGERETTKGTYTITKWADAGGYVEGTFSGTVVNWGDCKNYFFKSITGRFKAKRLN